MPYVRIFLQEVLAILGVMNLNGCDNKHVVKLKGKQNKNFGEKIFLKYKKAKAF